MNHSELAPSSAYRFALCAGFPNLLKQVSPLPVDKSAADEGNDAHWLAPAILEPSLKGDGFTVADSVAALLGSIAPSGSVITQTMMDHVMTYINHIIELADEGGGFESLTIEEKVVAQQIHPLAWGHTDAAMYQAEVYTACIRDLKYGWGIVEPRGLLQLIIYAAAKVTEYQAKGYRVDWIDMGVVQPRPWHQEGPIRNWVVHIDEWPAWVQYAREVYEAAADPNAVLTAGQHCKDCEARHECPALRRYTLSVYDYTSTVFVEQPTDEQLADEIRTLKAMEAGVKSRLSSLETVGISRVNAGAGLHGWTTYRKPGNRVFKKDADLAGIGSLLNVKLTEEKPITPAEAERRGVPKDLIKTMTNQPIGAAKLVPCDIQSKAKEVFNNG